VHIARRPRSFPQVAVLGEQDDSAAERPLHRCCRISAAHPLLHDKSAARARLCRCLRSNEFDLPNTEFEHLRVAQLFERPAIYAHVVEDCADDTRDGYPSAHA
jgi:hypothetical protein